jgi:hypothetical protein
LHRCYGSEKQISVALYNVHFSHMPFSNLPMSSQLCCAAAVV